MVVSTAELRHIGIVLVNNKQDNMRMVIFSSAVGFISSILLLMIGK